MSDNNYTIKTHITDADDLHVRVEFDYEPYEEPTNDYKEGYFHPGSPANIQLCSVHVIDVDDEEAHDILPILNELGVEQVTAKCWEHMSLINEEKENE